MSDRIDDMTGAQLRVGQQVAKAHARNNVSWIELQAVTRIENGKVYLDGSKWPLQCPERLLIIKP